MQSPGGLVVRALLLLGCLLALPFVAICGSSLPDVVQTALQGRLPSIEPSPARPDRETPQFVPDTKPQAGSRKETASRAAANSQEQIEQRLQQLGASYYRLEEWGNRRECFRFLCDMPIGNDPHLARSFQAVCADRLEAMADVLRQVETHRGG